jgi:hypothetical protein
MLLILMIPLALVALTIAVAPVLAMTVVHDREVRVGSTAADGPVRLPWGMGGTADVRVDEGQELARAA